jgi:hypothetical protein
MRNAPLDIMLNSNERVLSQEEEEEDMGNVFVGYFLINLTENYSFIF